MNKLDFAKKRVCVLGLGYIGLPTASLLANNGFEVQGVDINQETVDIINDGKIHIVEPDLDTFVSSAVKAGKLKAFIKPHEADIYIICVPTPLEINSQGELNPNIDYIKQAVKSIYHLVKTGDTIILESTSPIGTTNTIKNDFEDLGVDISSIFIAYCPERVLPGKIMVEIVENDRVIGGINNDSTDKVADFYKTFVNGNIYKTNCETAEMCKLIENSYRDVNIAFANEVSMIASDHNINTWELIDIANKHPRVNILQPGTGVGGHCIAVDPWFIVSEFKKESVIIRNAREINNYKTQWVIEKIKSTALEFELANNRKPTIALMGLAFKPDIDDLRESPALLVAETLLLDNKYNLLLVEPNLEENKKYDLTDFTETNGKADIVAYLVAHKDFKGFITECIELDFCGVKK